MKLNNVRPDFEPRGSLSLKPWIANDQGLSLPPYLALPVIEAMAPYNGQIKALSRQIGAVIPRQNMKDKSGATVMDSKTQVTSVHGHSVLDLALLPLEANFALPLVHEIAGENDRAMLDIAVAAETNLVGDPALIAADAAREGGNSPNTVMAAAAAIIGPKRVERALACAAKLIDLFAHSGLLDSRDEGFDCSAIKVDEHIRVLFVATAAEVSDPRPEAMLKAVRDRGGKSLFLKFLDSLGARPSRDAILAAISTTIASNSERAAENFISAVLPDRVDLPGRLRSNSPQVAQFFHRCLFARAAARSERWRSLRKNFRFRPERPRALTENPDASGLLKRKHARSAAKLQVHFGPRNLDWLRRSRPIDSANPEGPAPRL